MTSLFITKAMAAFGAHNAATTANAAPQANHEQTGTAQNTPGRRQNDARDKLRNAPLNGGNRPASARRRNNSPVPNNIFEVAIGWHLNDNKMLHPEHVGHLFSLSEVLEQRLANLDTLQATLPHEGDLLNVPNTAETIERNRKTEELDTPEKAKANAFKIKLENGLKLNRSKEEIELHILLESHFRTQPRNSETSQQQPIKSHDRQTRRIRGTSVSPAPAEKAGNTCIAKATSTIIGDPFGFDRKATGEAIARIAVKTRFGIQAVSPHDLESSTQPGTSDAKVRSKDQAIHGSTEVAVSNRFNAVHSAKVAARLKAHRDALQKNAGMDEWHDWMKANNISVAKNRGQNNNCLLLALLQHATGNYHENSWEGLEERAQLLRDAMVARYNDIKQGDLLLADCEAVQWAIGEINREYRRDLRLHTVVVQSNSVSGEVTPAIDYADSKGNEPVAVLWSGHHFEALTAHPSRAAATGRECAHAG